MKIRTKYKTNANGREQILATGGGKQRTVSYDHAKSSDWNHGHAAGTLALALGVEDHDGIFHNMSDDGVTHVFEV